MYLQRTFVNRRNERRKPGDSTVFPIVLPGGVRIDAERRQRSERRSDNRLENLQLFEDVPAEIVGELLASCPVREFQAETVVLTVVHRPWPQRQQ